MQFTTNYGEDEIEDAPAYGMASYEGDIARLMVRPLRGRCGHGRS